MSVWPVSSSYIMYLLGLVKLLDIRGLYREVIFKKDLIFVNLNLSISNLDPASDLVNLKILLCDAGPRNQLVVVVSS